MPQPKASDEEGDVTLEAFMSTSMFEAGNVDLTNEDATVLPEHVAKHPQKGTDEDAGDTVFIDRSADADDKDEKGDGSEDPTEVK